MATNEKAPARCERRGHGNRRAKLPMHDQTIPAGLCQCGCGGVTPIIQASCASRGLVRGKHRNYLHGHNRIATAVRVPLEDRFWPKVIEAKPGDLSPNGWGGCWLWTGASDRLGYGTIRVDAGKTTPAHRFAYALVVGAIPDGLEIDHLCRRPSCVNPAHLEAVTRLENVRRGLQGILKTHCPRGHAYTAENMQARKDGRRVCKICMRIHRANYKVRRAAAR